MANIKQNRIEIRGLTDDEINYLKSINDDKYLINKKTLYHLT